MNVTVFGATGVVGRALVPLLAEHELTAVSRTARDEPGVRWLVADAASGDGVAAALEGADVVYYLVHSLGAQDFEEQDRAAAETVAREAANAGVRQIVYLGGLGADGPDASPHLRSRRETGERLASAGVPVTTLRAAMIVGKGSAAFETILGLVKRLPVMVTPSWVSTPTQPIALDDVARYLAGVCGNEATYGEGYDTGGPEVMTYRQMIERIAALLGRKPANRRGPGADAVPLLALAEPRHAGERVGRAAARRRTAQSDDRARGADPEAVAARAHAVRRGGAAGARVKQHGHLTGPVVEDPLDARALPAAAARARRSRRGRAGSSVVLLFTTPAPTDGRPHRRAASNAEGTLREHQRGHGRPRAVTRLRPFPSSCAAFVPASSRPCPRFPPRRSMVRRGSTVRVRQRASAKSLQVAFSFAYFANVWHARALAGSSWRSLIARVRMPRLACASRSELW